MQKKPLRVPVAVREDHGMSLSGNCIPSAVEIKLPLTRFCVLSDEGACAYYARLLVWWLRTQAGSLVWPRQEIQAFWGKVLSHYKLVETIEVRCSRMRHLNLNFLNEGQ